MTEGTRLEKISVVHESTVETLDLNEQNELPAGIRLVRLPLPFKLNHINVYLLEGHDGSVLIDTGFASRETEEVWRVLLKELEVVGKPLRRILITHMHPDHLGMAAWLHDKTGAPVHLAEEEWRLARALWGPGEREVAAWHCYLDALGLPDTLNAKLKRNLDAYRKLVPRLPVDVQPLADGMEFVIGGRQWQTMVGRGHSPEHVCLWNPEERIFIGGDLVLPDITPNIGVMHIGPKNPLGDYLDSLDVFENLDLQWLLPSHGGISAGPSTRIGELRQHHLYQLNRLRGYCAFPRTAYQCTTFMFGERRELQTFVFAVREALAHLYYLVQSNELWSWDVNGVSLYQTYGSTSSHSCDGSL